MVPHKTTCGAIRETMGRTPKRCKLAGCIFSALALKVLGLAMMMIGRSLCDEAQRCLSRSHLRERKKGRGRCAVCS